MLGFLALLQLLTGMSNIILDWPLIAALMHTGGAAAILVVLVRLLPLSRRLS
jgi:cytochrome c oxidase assembly protein subunit 15